MKRGLYIGRFQPFHKGHLYSLKWCSDRVDELIVAVGSSDKSFELRNPFTAGERIEIIRENITTEIREKRDRIIPIPVPDVGVHLLWTHNIDLLDLIFVTFTGVPIIVEIVIALLRICPPPSPIEPSTTNIYKNFLKIGSV